MTAVTQMTAVAQMAGLVQCLQERWQQVLGVLVAAIGIVAIIVKEMLKEKELKKDKYLD